MFILKRVYLERNELRCYYINYSFIAFVYREVNSHQKRLDQINNIDVRKKLKKMKQISLNEIHEKKERQNNFFNKGNFLTIWMKKFCFS